jgi:hypothetical protein
MTYYYGHRDAENIYPTYEDWRKDHAYQMLGNKKEENMERKEREPSGGDI